MKPTINYTIEYNTRFVKHSVHIQVGIKSAGWVWTVLCEIIVSCEERCTLSLRFK